jgi:two-component system, cell cycle sensor histidine kinase and response regulator CckA
VRQSGGLVRLESRLGRGTTVRLFLPRFRTAASSWTAGKTDPEGDQPVLGGFRSPAGQVLVVDDEEAVRRSSARLLARAGFEVLEAGSAADALALLGERPIDVLLSDIVMPEVSGIELAVAAREVWPHAGILLISAFTPAALTRHKLTDETGGRILQKPVERSELVAAVAAAAGAAA